MKIYKQAILPKGFLASGLYCGIKKSKKPDLALFYSAIPAKSACLFTANKLPAAPLLLNKIYLKKTNFVQAIIVNSGNANCFTGFTGIKDAAETAISVADELDIKAESVLVNSTGIIGKRLPKDLIKKAVPTLIKGLSSKGIHQAKKAILTTDTFAKEVTVKFNLGQKEVTICGIAKGAGMIAPNMATMLCFIFTDADITSTALKAALKKCTDKTFNCITIDGCMSTNDSVMMLANAAAGNALIEKGKAVDLFTQALNIVCLELAKMVVRDAEGGTKFIQIKVSTAKSEKEAKAAALAIANSNLFKTAVYGENPNFGRIAAAVGASGVAVKENSLKIKVSSLKKKDIFVDVSLGQGNAGTVVYTSDLTPEYVKINAEYN